MLARVSGCCSACADSPVAWQRLDTGGDLRGDLPCSSLVCMLNALPAVTHLAVLTSSVSPGGRERELHDWEVTTSDAVSTDALAEAYTRLTVANGSTLALKHFRRLLLPREHALLGNMPVPYMACCG